MTHQPRPLSAELAELRSATSRAAATGWVENYVIEIIMACLARLFARLEQLLQLWTAGTLPLPPVRVQSPHLRQSAPPPATARPKTPRACRHRPAAPRRRLIYTRPAGDRGIASRVVTAPTPAPLARAARSSALRPRSARASPRQKPPIPKPQPAPKLLRYHNIKQTNKSFLVLFFKKEPFLLPC